MLKPAVAKAGVNEGEVLGEGVSCVDVALAEIHQEHAMAKAGEGKGQPSGVSGRERDASGNTSTVVTPGHIQLLR